MRSIHLTRRLILSVILAATLGGASVPAALAGSTTHHVGPGGGDGACASPAFSGIQAAVNAAAPGDTILVCPGTYAQRLVIGTPDLTIRAVSRWTAIVRPPATAPSPLVLIADTADGTTLQWLKVVARTSGAGCIPHDGIRVDASGVSIRANRVIAARGGDTRTGPCRLENGIHVAPGAGATVTYNLVQDFSFQGIWAQSAVSATITHNSVRYWHPLTSVCASTACVSKAGPAAAPIATQTGINIFNTPAVVRGNAVTATPGAIAGDQPTYGIRANSTSPVVVRGNVIRRATNGIILDPAVGSTIRANDVEDASFGIVLRAGSDGSTVRGNHVRAIISHGIWMQAGTGNEFIGNDASTAQAAIDCYDSAGATNDWQGNLGVTSNPSGICAAP